MSNKNEFDYETLFAEIHDLADDALSRVEERRPRAERELFAAQLAEAEAVDAGKPAGFALKELARGRGESVESLARKVIDADDAHRRRKAKIAGLAKRAELRVEKAEIADSPESAESAIEALKNAYEKM